MKKLTLFFIVCCLAFFSCKKEELPIPKHDPGDVITQTVNMNADYKYQLYFNLETNTVVGQNLKTIWDLGFETTDDGFHVVLNTSKAMYAFNTGSVDFISVTDTLGFAAGKHWDVPSGNLDSTAIGNWKNSTPVYIIDRGYSETGTHLGYRKIQLLSSNSVAYTLRFGKLDGSNDTTLQVLKDSAYNFTFFSFSTSSEVMVEPVKSSWDLMFTQYIHVFYEPEPLPYLVTGCLLNRNNVYATMDSTVLFTNIDLGYASQLDFVPDINTIGYKWKTFTGSTYTTNLDYNYIIKSRNGRYYKLHFIDFYNSSGEKGNPKWEYQEL